MSPWAAAAWGALAAASLLVGGWLAVDARPSSHLTGLVIAFSAGALIKSIVLGALLDAVPESLVLGMSAAGFAAATALAMLE